MVKMNPKDMRKENILFVNPENMNSRPPMPAVSMDMDATALNNESL